MSDKKLPVVHVEINSGTFTIPTADKIYEITVQQTPSIARIVDSIVASESDAGTPGECLKPGTGAAAQVQETGGAQSAQTEQELKYITLYREISEEMFRDIGRLARDLSISIKDLPCNYEREVNLEKAGLDLESAKSMLEDVVKMTETATMTIMDISENMQEQCTIIKKNLEDVRALNFVGNALCETDAEGAKDPMILLRDMLVSLRALRESLYVLAAGESAVQFADEGASVHSVLDGLDHQILQLEQEYTRHIHSTERYMVVNESYSMVRKADHDRLVTALESSDQVIQCIIGNIGRILESLSFQDLSGQRIVKIVDLLSNVQVQLLSILVSSGVKLKRLREGRALEQGDTAAEASELLSRIRGDTTSNGKTKNLLDQQAIDSLLQDLGF